MRTGPWARWSHACVVRLILMTGRRSSKVLDLEWSWVSRERLEIVLRDSKTGLSVRRISPALLDEREAYREPGARVLSEADCVPVDRRENDR